MNKIIAFLIVFSFSLKATAVNYYVNDGSTVGDVYTAAIGNNINPGTSGLPFSTLGAALAVAVSGDHIYVDAGSYADVNLFIPNTLNNLTITGASISTTIFDGSPGSGVFLFMTISGSNVIVENITIQQYNNAGAIDVVSGSVIDSTFVQFNWCYFYQNETFSSFDATPHGGAVIIQTLGGNTPSSVSFYDCQFADNMAEQGNGGGAVAVEDRSRLYMKRCRLTCNNSRAVLTTFEGGTVLFDDGYGTLDECFISGSSVFDQQGGAVRGINGTNRFVINIANSIFTDNSARQGAAIYMEDNIDCNIINTLVHGNTVTGGFGNGGSISTAGAVNMYIVNSTIADNLSTHSSDGGGLADDGSSSYNIFNTIIWNNQISNVRNASINATYSCIEPVNDNHSGVLGNITGNPLFTNTTDFTLQVGSPCIDAGNLTGAPITDLTIFTRSGNPDMGAFELGSAFPVTDLNCELFLECTPPAILPLSIVSTSICEGEIAIITIDNSEVGINYQLVDFSTSTAIGPPVIGSGGTISLPSGTLTQDITFTVAAYDPTSPTCTETLGPIVITVNPIIFADAGTDGALIVCQGIIPNDAALFAALSGSPTAGGIWSNVGLTYTYTVGAGQPCTTLATSEVLVTEEAQPSAGANSTISVCAAGEAIDLYDILLGSPETTGNWSGGLTGMHLGTYNPTTFAPGLYTYTITSLSCADVSADVLVIESDTLPPSGNGSQSFCLDAGPLVSDIIAIGNDIEWYSDAGATNLLNATDLLTNGSTYYATQTSTIDGCESSNSLPVSIVLSNPVLDTTNYIMIESTCGSNDGSITGITVSGGQPSYNWEWTNLSGLISNNQDITNATAGSYAVVVTDALGCQDSVQALFIGNNGAANIDISSSAVVNETCGNNNGSITGVMVTGGNGVLSYEWSDGSSIISSDLDLFPISAGNYTLTVIDANNCVSTAGPFSLSDLDGPSLDLNSLAIENTTCNESNGSITGISVNGGNGVIQIEWSDGSSVIGNTLDINGLTAGSYSLVITDTNNCIATIDTTISSDPIPTVLAEDDYAMTDPSTEVIVIIDTNDIGDVTTIQIVNGPENGVATVDLMGNLTYTPNDGYSGIDSLVYTICDEFCSLECENASVYITVEDLVPLHIPNGFSPNSDGFNDTFVIEGLDQYPDNEIIIFNRWGDEVFSAGPYLNDWIGSTTNEKLKITGDQVTEGTYYYILDIHAEGIQPYNGFIELRRN